MNKKIITLILTGLISTSFVGPTYVSAAEIKKTTTQDKYINEMSINDAITIIEDKYLIQNDNGTFSIDEAAKSIIGDKLFSELESGMNQVNVLIENDVLEFDKNRQATKFDQEKQNLISPRATDAYSEVLSSYKYCSNYQWYWWGFETNVNPDGSAHLAKEVIKTIAMVAAGGASIGWIPGFAIPVGIVGAALEAWLVTIHVEFDKGSGARGTAVTALGAPSAPQITDANTLY